MRKHHAREEKSEERTEDYVERRGDRRNCALHVIDYRQVCRIQQRGSESERNADGIEVRVRTDTRYADHERHPRHGAQEYASAFERQRIGAARGAGKREPRGVREKEKRDYARRNESQSGKTHVCTHRLDHAADYEQSDPRAPMPSHRCVRNHEQRDDREQEPPEDQVEYGHPFAGGEDGKDRYRAKGDG